MLDVHNVHDVHDNVGHIRDSHVYDVHVYGVHVYDTHVCDAHVYCLCICYGDLYNVNVDNVYFNDYNQHVIYLQIYVHEDVNDVNYHKNNS